MQIKRQCTVVARHTIIDKSLLPHQNNTNTDHGENKFSIQQKKIEQLEEKITKLTDMVFCMKQTIDERLPVNRFPNNTQQF